MNDTPGGRDAWRPTDYLIVWAMVIGTGAFWGLVAWWLAS